MAWVGINLALGRNVWGEPQGTVSPSPTVTQTDTPFPSITPTNTTAGLSLTVNSYLYENGVPTSTPIAVPFMASFNGAAATAHTTPVTFPIQNGTTYNITAQNTSTHSFVQWSKPPGTVITTPTRAGTFQSAVPVTFTAYYQAGGGSTEPTISVAAQTTTGQVLNMHTVLFDAAGVTVIDEGFTPVTLDAGVAGTYQLEAQNFGIYTFAHWNDGNTNQRRTITLPGQASLIAIYNVGA